MSRLPPFTNRDCSRPLPQSFPRMARAGNNDQLEATGGVGEKKARELVFSPAVQHPTGNAELFGGERLIAVRTQEHFLDDPVLQIRSARDYSQPGT